MVENDYFSYKNNSEINQETPTFVLRTQLANPSHDTTTNISSLKMNHDEEVQDDLFYRLQEENAKLPPQDSTAFILAQIERQNVLLEKDPKSIYIQSNKLKANFSTVQRLVKHNVIIDEDDKDIDWGFWEAVIQDSDKVALRLPHLLSTKLRSGIPSRVRGLMWQAMSKSASLHLEKVYKQLCEEKSPHERIIQRDLSRTFPRIEMFKQENGQGQTMMRKVLEAYSLYDTDVGYCQGLAFLVGPLLMNMTETQSFCVFVRLMETYEMRSMFTLNMEGLQLRLFQFSSLLVEIVPDLSRHLELHGVHAAMYASQWFLTLFAYGFPMDLVTRIYDIIFAEGAAETIMRVSISMLKRSHDSILQLTEFEDILDFVTSKKLCEPYTSNYSIVIKDAMALSHIITRDKMDGLCQEYNTGTIGKQKRDLVLAETGRFAFWKRRNQNIKKLAEVTTDLKRSASTGNQRVSATSIVSERSATQASAAAITTTNAALPYALQKRWSSVSSRRDWSYNTSSTVDSSFPTCNNIIMAESSVPPPTPPKSFEFSTIDSRLRTAPENANVNLDFILSQFEQLKHQHEKACRELLELKYDKHDLESERDALKLTVIELERGGHYHKTQRQEGNEEHLLFGCGNSSATNDAVSSTIVADTSFSDLAVGDSNEHYISKNSDSKTTTTTVVNTPSPSILESYTTTECDDETFSLATNQSSPFLTGSNNGFEEQDNSLSSQLVHTKVKNFELEQQVDKLTLDLETTTSKLEMIQEGQMNLVDTLMKMKTEMDELAAQSKDKDILISQTNQNNQTLLQQLQKTKADLRKSRIENSVLTQDVQMLKKDQAMLDEENLPFTIIKIKGRIRRHSTSSTPKLVVRNKRVHELENSLVSLKIKLAEIEASNNDRLKKKNSLYGRMLHAITTTNRK